MTSDIENPAGAARSATGRASLFASPLLLAGGLLGAVGASSCCLVPLALFGLGISGAWIANLTRLARYQPYFLGLSGACLVAGCWRVWRARRTACADGEVCARPLPSRVVMTSFALATILVAAAVAVDFVLPLFLVP